MTTTKDVLKPTKLVDKSVDYLEQFAWRRCPDCKAEDKIKCVEWSSLLQFERQERYKIINILKELKLTDHKGCPVCKNKDESHGYYLIEKDAIQGMIKELELELNEVTNGLPPTSKEVEYPDYDI